jgi:hypothetical protein
MSGPAKFYSVVGSAGCLRAARWVFSLAIRDLLNLIGQLNGPLTSTDEPLMRRLSCSKEVAVPYRHFSTYVDGLKSIHEHRARPTA